MHLLVDKFSHRHRALGAQQVVKRYRTPELVLGIDNVKLPKPLGQIRRFAHVVDCLPDRPGRRDRDKFGLHAPACRVFRIEQTARQGDAFPRRKLLQNLALLVFGQVFQNRDRIVGIELAHAFGNRLGRKFLENFFANRIVNFSERGEVEIMPHQLDQTRAQLRIERFDEIAEIGFVQIADQFAQHA